MILIAIYFVLTRFTGYNTAYDVLKFLIAVTIAQCRFEAYIIVPKKTGSEMTVCSETQAIANMTEMAAYGTNEAYFSLTAFDFVNPGRPVCIVFPTGNRYKRIK